MRFARVQNGIVVETWDQAAGSDLASVFEPELVDQFIQCNAEVEQGWRHIAGEWEAPQQPDALTTAKQIRIDGIKVEAAERIAATDWRLERARERAAQGLENPETEADVLAEREAIRQASNAAESAVMSLSSVEEVTAFSW